MASTNTVKTIKIELLRKFAMSNAAALYTEVQFLSTRPCSHKYEATL